MKYYLIFITRDNSGKETPSIYTYDSLNEAVASFHKQLGGWMAKEEITHIIATVMDSEGAIYKNETYNK